MEIILLLTLLFSPNSTSFTLSFDYDSYCNSRFHYCINFPTFLFAEPESENGDGRIFVNKEGTEVLRVYGRINQDANGNAITLRKQYLLDIKSLNSTKSKITYQKFEKDYYVLSGEKNNRIFYQKVIVKEDAFCYALLNYNRLAKDTYDSVSSEIYRSFK